MSKQYTFTELELDYTVYYCVDFMGNNKIAEVCKSAFTRLARENNGVIIKGIEASIKKSAKNIAEVISICKTVFDSEELELDLKSVSTLVQLFASAATPIKNAMMPLLQSLYTKNANTFEEACQDLPSRLKDGLFSKLGRKPTVKTPTIVDVSIPTNNKDEEFYLSVIRRINIGSDEEKVCS